MKGSESWRDAAKISADVTTCAWEVNGCFCSLKRATSQSDPITKMILLQYCRLVLSSHCDRRLENNMVFTAASWLWQVQVQSYSTFKSIYLFLDNLGRHHVAKSQGGKLHFLTFLLRTQLLPQHRYHLLFHHASSHVGILSGLPWRMAHPTSC